MTSSYVIPASSADSVRVLSRQVLAFVFAFFLVLGVSGAAFAASESSSSENFPPAVIAVVDMQKIMGESSAAQSVKKQLASRRQAYQEEVTADEQMLREEEKELMIARKTMSDEEFKEKRQAFEARVGEVQRKIQRRTQALDTAFNKALATIKQSLGKIVAQKASEHGATFVLDRGQTVVVESSYDITDVVLKELNKTLPKVDVSIDED